MTLTKAKLIDVEHQNNLKHENHIDFMFNPNELSFGRSMSWEQSTAARTDSGENKTSFKHPYPYSLDISNIILDTYEEQVSVLPHLQKFTRAVEFMQGGKNDNKRPPIFLFVWGSNSYLRCYVKKLDFKLVLFLANGTPVRAIVTLSLGQAGKANPNPGQGVSTVSANQRASSNRQLFLR